ncbi:hypothetical protein E5D57_011756 [Metarhizium anisopliae]|nr:hypothetical protein E5D57_011756 [Metarhizium anisopliae]
MRYRGSEKQNPHLQTAEAEAKMEMENGDAASNASAGFTDEPEAAQGAHMSRRERRRRMHSLEIRRVKCVDGDGRPRPPDVQMMTAQLDADMGSGGIPHCAEAASNVERRRASH